MFFHPSRFAIVALAASLAMPVFAGAAEPERREAVIVVSGEGDSSIAPDMAVVTLGVTQTEKTARAALDGNSKAMAAVLKALKEQGIADKDLQTSSFSIQPQFSYPANNDGSDKPPVLSGYQVSNTLMVRVRDITKLGALLDQSVTLGVNQGGDIHFTNADPARTVDTARRAAVKDAFAKAKTLAEAAGVKLGRVIEITDNAIRAEPVPAMRMSMAKQADAVPVATGENSYTVSVSVTFAIEQ